ncbi:MAG: hypothetical protein ACK421_08390 [Pseudanabaenaceae cyanobacterium]
MQINFEAWRNGWVCRDRGRFCPLPEDKKKVTNNTSNNNTNTEKNKSKNPIEALAIIIAGQVALAANKLRNEMKKRDFKGMKPEEINNFVTYLTSEGQVLKKKIKGLDDEMLKISGQLKKVDGKEAKKLLEQLNNLRQEKKKALKVLEDSEKKAREGMKILKKLGKWT